MENEALKDKVENLTNSLIKFTNGKDNLDKLLGMQMCVFDKAGLCYNQIDNQKDYNNLQTGPTSCKSSLSINGVSLPNKEENRCLSSMAN